MLIDRSDGLLRHGRLSRKYVVKQLAARLRPQLEATVKHNESAPGDSFVPGEFDQVLTSLNAILGLRPCFTGLGRTSACSKQSSLNRPQCLALLSLH